MVGSRAASPSWSSASRPGAIRITIANTKTATLECGRYMDALQVTVGDIVSPLWLGVILVAANPRRVMLPT
jgi:hypothetical protein